MPCRRGDLEMGRLAGAGRRGYVGAHEKEVMSTIERNSAPKPARRAFNLRALFALLLAAAALCGCARRYDMTLTNGGRVINVRKPVRSKEGGNFTVTTADGKRLVISSDRVLSIVPHGDKD